MNAVISGKSPFCFKVGVILKKFISLMGRLIAFSAKIAADRRTDRQTDRQTDAHTKTKYNPHCACTPRVYYAPVDCHALLLVF